MEDNYFLYRHIRLDKNEPFYIGIGTKKKWFTDFKTEYRRAFEKANRTKHWNNIINKTEYDVEIMLESDNYNYIKEKEKEFIITYGRKDLGKGTLVNFTDGGEGTVGIIISEESRRKQSLSRTGGHRKGVTIYQYDLKGGFIREWSSIKEAEIYLNNKNTGAITKCVNGSCETSHGFYWSKIFVENFINFKKERTGRKIYQYDLDGTFIKEWSSIINASKDLKISTNSLNSCLTKQTHKSKGFVWDYSYMTKEEFLNTRSQVIFKSIKQLTLNGELIKVHTSMRELCNELFPDRDFKSTKTNILKVLAKNRKRILGYKWEYLDESSN